MNVPVMEGIIMEWSFQIVFEMSLLHTVESIEGGGLLPS